MPELGLDKVVTQETKSFLLDAFRQGSGIAQEQKLTWQPFPDINGVPHPQRCAIESEADELFFGGSAGGGKTGLVCGLAACYHYKVVIFRTTYGQLTEIRDQLSEILGEYGRYNSIKNTFRNLNNGGIIELAAVSLDKDLDKWKGRAHDLIAFDEVPEIPFFHYQFLTIWNRSTKPGQRVRTICTGNPPTTDKGRWVINYWAPWLDKDYEAKTGRKKALPGELRWFVTRAGNPSLTAPELHFEEVDGPEPVERNGERLTPRSRTFIPAFLSDNPMFEGTGYRAKLQQLPETLREAYLYGRFDLEVEIKDDPFQVIPRQWIIDAQRRWQTFTHTYGGVDAVIRQEKLTAIGLDPSRGGEDATGISRRYTHWFAPVKLEYGNTVEDGIKVAQLVLGLMSTTGYEVPVFVDLIGWGSSPYDILRMAGLKMVFPVDARERSGLADRSGLLFFANKRAEVWWTLREALDPAYDPQLMLPPSETLLQDLTSARWELRTNGIVIESKEEIKKRLKRSPDEGEALAYSLCTPPVPRIKNLGEMLNEGGVYG